MEIETYEILETPDAGGGVAEEERIQMVELADKLGLAGQKKLLLPSENGQTQVFPYKLMTKEEEHVYETLFPVKTEVHDYNEQAIPLRVLQVAAHALTFVPHVVKHNVRVWHERGSKDDPLLVAHNESYGGKLWLLARWGSALDTFERLKKKATEILRVRKTKAFRDRIEDAEKNIRNLDDTIASYLDGDEIYWSA